MITPKELLRLREYAAKSYNVAMTECLDEIDRLNARIKELETHGAEALMQGLTEI